MTSHLIYTICGRAIVNRFRRAGATNAHFAVRPEILGVPRSATLDHMKHCGAMRTTRDGRCFLNEPMAMEFLHERNVRGAVIATIACTFVLWGIVHWGLL